MRARLEKMCRSVGRVMVGTLALVCATPSRPARADEHVVPEARIESARGIALGTGARSSSASTQAQAENPANLPVGALYHIETFLGYQPTFKRMGWGASVVDSMTSRLAAGLSARGLFGDNKAGENSGWEGRLGLGFPLGDMLSLGVAGRYANFKLSDPKAVPESPPKPKAVPDRTFKLKGFTLDAAATLRPVQMLAISALAYNLIDMDSPLAPLTVGGSLSLTPSAGLTLGGDVLVDLNQHKQFNGSKLLAGGGLEYFAAGLVPLRVGYLFDQGRSSHGVTGGIGYVDQRIGVQLSVRQLVSGAQETTVFGALQYFVQ